MLFTIVMYKFLVRVVKIGILFTKNMPKCSVKLQCMLLIVASIFMMYRLTFRGLVSAVLPFRAEILIP